MTRAGVWARGAAVLTCSIGLTGCGDDSVATTPTTVTSPTTVTWTTSIGPRGSASRTFTSSQPGVVSVGLQASPVALGIGIGVTPQSGGVCRPAVSMTASPGDAPLTAPIEQGDYCVLVYDVGRIDVERLTFTLALEYP